MGQSRVVVGTEQGSRVVVGTEHDGGWDRAGWWLGQSMVVVGTEQGSRVVVGTEQGGGWDRAGRWLGHLCCTQRQSVGRTPTTEKTSTEALTVET